MNTINLLGIYGAGNDAAFGGALRGLVGAVQADAKSMGYEKYVYVPRIMDYLEATTIIRLVKQWKDPTILLSHSCGCLTATMATNEDTMSPFPYVACIAPSMFCYPKPVAPNVARIDQFTSNTFDVFNLGARQLVTRMKSNSRTQVNVLKTGLPHLGAPASSLVHSTVIQQVRKAVGVSS